MKRLFVYLAVVLGLELPLHASNLLSNGSFENGNFVPDADDSMSLSAGATDISGWTVENAALAWIGPSNPFSLSASDGSYFLDLSGYHDNAPYGAVQTSQIIATTIGAPYELTFEIGSDVTYDSDGNTFPAIPVSVQVTAGSGSQLFTTATPTGNNEWQSFAFDFTATSANTTITLAGEASQNIEYIGLDNVDLEAVPEPGTLVLLAGPGLLALVVHRRLRKG